MNRMDVLNLYAAGLTITAYKYILNLKKVHYKGEINDICQ
jgi:hypothetical protein